MRTETIPLVDLKKNYYSIKKEINKAIKEVIENTDFIMGKHVEKFDINFAKFCDAKFASGVANGTVALHLALHVLGVSKNDEVILPPNTFIATAEAVSHCGAKPVFVDVDPQTHTIDISKIEKTINKKTKAIIAVHLYGHPCDMDVIMKIAKKYKLKVVEDCAQAHGAKYKGKMVGSIGNIGCFSMFPAKIIGAYGDAGAVVTNDSCYAKKIAILRDHGRISKYEHIEIGFNYRIDALQAAILNVKLKKVDEWITQRRKIASIYNSLLCEYVKKPIEKEWAKHVYYIYVIETDNRNKLKDYLTKKGISTGIHFPVPLHLQPAYKYLGYKKENFPNAENIAKKILTIPLFPEMNIQQIEYISQQINSFLRNL